MYRLIFAFLLLSQTLFCQDADFKFAFLTDIHLNSKAKNCFQGFNQAIENAKDNNASFIITGGDNVDIDIMGNKKQEAESLYKKYKETLESSEIAIYPTIGNHDRFMGDNKNDELFNEGMFEKYISKAYYSFDHQGWHFIVLNSTQKTNNEYCVDKAQIDWLKNDLEKLSKETPIIVSVHVPFLSLYYPAVDGEYKSTDTFSNFKEVWDMFDNNNLKLVLQGHMHLYEEIKIKDVQFITAGAVSAAWWTGSYYGTEEGYLMVTVSGDSFNWEYIDYGWNAK